MLNNRGVLDVGLNWRPSWTPSSIAQNAQWCQGGITHILNLDILSFLLIPTTKLLTTSEGSNKMWVSLPDYKHYVPGSKMVGNTTPINTVPHSNNTMTTNTSIHMLIMKNGSEDKTTST
jgi:hypothetical protein